MINVTATVLLGMENLATTYPIDATMMCII